MHFGLGPDTRAEAVEIHWPSGRIQEFKNVPVDHVLMVTESTGAHSVESRE